MSAIHNREMVIFDMDGVILDSEPLHERARRYMFEKYGVKVGNDLPNPVGNSTKGFWDILKKKYSLDVDTDEMEDEHFGIVADYVESERVPLSAGLPELFQWLKSEGIKIGLASSSMPRLVYRVLELFEIEQYFDAVVTGRDVAARKPAPDIYLRALELAKVSPQNAAAVEDSKSGIEAAKTAGIYCFGYRNPTSGNESLDEADLIIKELNEIRKLI